MTTVLIDDIGLLVTTYPGDTTMATVDQVRSFAKGGSARIQR